MLTKNIPKLNIRRRRSLLIRCIILLLCICLFFQMKYHMFDSSPKRIQIISNTPVINQSFNKSILNCFGEPLQKWCQNYIRYCNDSLIIYNNLFVITHSALIQPKFAIGKRLGGEELQDVLNQPEKDEYFQFKQNFIQLPCDISKIDSKLPAGHLSNIFTSINSWKIHNVTQKINETTIAIRREDYVNFYHTITDLYTVYLLCRFFQYDPKSVRILFIDAHPKGNLDLLWSEMFHSYTRLGHLKNISSIEYRELIWSQPQPKSEIDVERRRTEAPSFFNDFREYILKQFNIDYQTNPNINCESLNIFFLVRHNYVAHPRNPTGKVTRQLTNEQQVLDELKTKFAQYSNVNFTFNHFEQLSFVEQLKTIINTDVFTGIHGAGLTHVLFLKSNRILVELTVPSRSADHFNLLASMNKVNYISCSLTEGSPKTAQTIYDCIVAKLLPICPLKTITRNNTLITGNSLISKENTSNRTVNG